MRRHVAQQPGFALARRSVGLFLALALASRPPAPALAQQRSSERSRSWTVELHEPGESSQAGAPTYPSLPRHRSGHPNLTLEVHPHGIRLLRTDRVLIDISGKSVIGLLYDTAVYRPVVAYFKTQGSEIAAEAAEATVEAMEAPSPLGLLVPPTYVTLFVVVPAALLVPFATEQHFISIVWRDGPRARDVMLQVRGDEREEILGAVRDAADLAWRDVPAERRLLKDRIEASEGQDFPIRLEQEVLLGGAWLEVGRYQGLVVEGEGSTRELLLFRGRKAKVKNLVARTPVAIEAAAAPFEGTALMYQEDAAGPRLAEVRTGDRSLELPVYRASEVGVPARQEPGAEIRTVRFDAGKYGRAEVRATTLGEEPAFLFGALEVKFGHQSAGDLYVTPTRIVYAPASLLEDRLEAPRSGLRDVRIRSLLGGRQLVFEHDEKSYAFRMYSFTARSVGLFEMTRHAAKIGRTEQRVVEFARLAIEDFKAAERQFDEWVAAGGLVSTLEEPSRSEGED